MAASTSAVSMAMPLIRATRDTQPNADAFLKPIPVKPSKAIAVSKVPVGKFEVKASLKEKMVTGLTAGALTASMMVPDVAEAASGVSPSLKNFLLSIVAGGVVLVVILGAVIGVSNFDPVKRS
ncbi:membrane family [Olea europaea subsp. europaea]|uniref:Membrane family n=1 Tax=Olea europaea subsp. europaea TaxID=158383 RepID=A0A8S0UVC4_OLEEU|nr:membrane family [Olea europaea subsp. europaea]